MQNYGKIILELAWCDEGARHASFRLVCSLSLHLSASPSLSLLFETVIFTITTVCVFLVKHWLHFIIAIIVCVTDVFVFIIIRR